MARSAQARASWYAPLSRNHAAAVLSTPGETGRSARQVSTRSGLSGPMPAEIGAIVLAVIISTDPGNRRIPSS